MALWDREPGIHLIDMIVALFPSERGWLRHEFDTLAATTHRPDGQLQPDGRVRWHRDLTHPDTLGSIRIRVVLDADGTTIVTAFPL
jgi:hypothetical protein